MGLGGTKEKRELGYRSLLPDEVMVKEMEPYELGYIEMR
jgi:hypothetical protein